MKVKATAMAGLVAVAAAAAAINHSHHQRRHAGHGKADSASTGKGKGGAAQPGIDLIVGLGNPGKRYAETRHNAGFQFIALLQSAHGAPLAAARRFEAEVGKVQIGGTGGGGERALQVMMPTAFMNLSGQAVAQMAAFYRIPTQRILVVHDDLDLPPGAARLKASGGHGGHNGLRDIIARLGGGFPRLRIGIGRPPPGRDAAAYVLEKPTAAEAQGMAQAMARALEVLGDVVDGNFDAAMKRLHTESESEPASKSVSNDPKEPRRGL